MPRFLVTLRSELNLQIACLQTSQDLEARIVLQGTYDIWRNVGGYVDGTRTQSGHTGLIIGEDFEVDLVEITSVLVPIVRVTHQYGVIVRHELSQPVGAGTDALGQDVDFVVHPLGHDVRVTSPGHVADQRRIRLR